VNHSVWSTRRAKKLAGEALEEQSPEMAQLERETEAAIAIGQAVHDARTTRNWSQAELARRAGMSQPAVARLETSLDLPSTRTLVRVAAALDSTLKVSIDDAA
jgi:HTH-type transcriptional regulator/antitoxin HipB